MPKMKTNKMAAKKFRVTGSGRVKRARANRSHLTSKRAPKRMRQLRRPAYVGPELENIVRRMLPNG